jgi:hypothetical protein
MFFIAFHQIFNTGYKGIEIRESHVREEVWDFNFKGEILDIFIIRIFRSVETIPMATSGAPRCPTFNPSKAANFIGWFLQSTFAL